jgi:MFS family permease
VIRLVMVASVAAAACMGFTAPLVYGVVVVLALAYSAVVQLDSAALTAGAVEAADPDRRGATMAIHSLIGFGCAFVGPLVVGMVLDLTGDATTALSWGLAFLSVAAVGLLGPAQFGAQRIGPGLPGEQPALDQRKRGRQRLRLPRLVEHRLAVAAGQRSERLALRRAQDSFPTDR